MLCLLRSSHPAPHKAVLASSDVKQPSDREWFELEKADLERHLREEYDRLRSQEDLESKRKMVKLIKKHKLDMENAQRQVRLDTERELTEGSCHMPPRSVTCAHVFLAALRHSIQP